MQKLQEMLERQPDDPFLLYALGMEHRKAGNLPEALHYLTKVVERDPGYCAAYQHAGQIFEQMGDLDAARNAYGQGIAAASRSGDQHARQEMQQALNLLA